MYTIVGLVNEGGRDRFSRHAIGARFLDFIRQECPATPWEHQGDVKYCLATLPSGRDVQLLQQTAGKLHQAGEVLAPHLIDVTNWQTLVVYDEAGLDLGEVQLYDPAPQQTRHMGLRNLIRELETDHFARAAIGIGIIPLNEQEWEDFFNAPLTGADLTRARREFELLLGLIDDHVSGLRPNTPPGLTPVPNDAVLAAQLPQRRRNLVTAPFAVTVDQRRAHHLSRSIRTLTRLIQRTAGEYGRACHQDDPSRSRLVRLLEKGIPARFTPLARTTRFHIEHLSFDFQGDRLLEINPAPLPPLVASTVRANLDLAGPGVTLTPELLCERIIILARRHQRGGRRGKILLVNQIGDVELGKSGWLDTIAQYLEESGFPTAIGEVAEHPDADVIWGNLTWMTPDRWDDVTSSRVGLRSPEAAQVFPAPRNFLFTSKWFLSLLSSPEGRQVLGVSASDEQTLNDVIPWTAPLAESDDIIRMALRHGIRLYGKPYLSSGGRGGSSVKRLSDTRDVATPAVIQEWVEPDTVAGGHHDFRICVYGSQGHHHVWSARVWSGSRTLQRPMDAPIIYR